MWSLRIFSALGALLSLAKSVSGQASACGSLITYRQHAVLLSGAPQCFRDGCGAPSPATSMSSDCPPTSPCRPLWELLRTQYQKDWCIDCPDDVACRIHGWPVLNATAACNIIPHEYLFSSAAANEACCIAGDEPFLLADWVGALCNGSEWRAPFEYYGGMAREDWEQWIEAWNWTVGRQGAADQNATASDCASSNDILWTYGIEDLLVAVSIVAVSGIGYFLARIGATLEGAVWSDTRLARIIKWVLAKKSKNFHWTLVILASVGEIASWTVSTLVNAGQIVTKPGYEEVPYGELVLLLLARPCPLGLLSAFGLLIPRLEDSSDSTAQGGRSAGRQVLAKIVATFVLAETIILIVSSKYPILTVIAARYRGFYPVSNLTPYWHGQPAALMYAGGLTWTVLFPLVIIGLLVVTLMHVHKVRVEYKNRTTKPGRRYLKYVRPFLEAEWDAEQDQQAAEAQEIGHRGNYLSAVLNAFPHLLHSVVVRAVVYSHNIGVDDLERQRAETQEEKLDFARTQRTVAKVEDELESWRTQLTVFVLFLCAMVYTAQWVFWAGFVEAKDSRWCFPHDDNFVPKFRGVFAVFSVIGTIFSYVYNVYF